MPILCSQGNLVSYKGFDPRWPVCNIVPYRTSLQSMAMASPAFVPEQVMIQRQGGCPGATPAAFEVWAEATGSHITMLELSVALHASWTAETAAATPPLAPRPSVRQASAFILTNLKVKSV